MTWNMKYSKKSILVSILLFGFVSLFGLPYAQAIEYGGLGIYPNESEVDEKNFLTKSWFIYILELGELKEAKVDVVNTSDSPVEVKVYPVDAVTTKDGAFAPEPESREKVDVGTWITLSESEFSLGPQETKTIDFTIQVPENAEVGDHAGTIIIQSNEPKEKVEGSGLQISTRVGARIYITIPGDIVRELKFTEFVLKRGDEKTILFLTLVNNGNVRIRLKGNIEIKDIFGKVTDILNIPEREVFPRKTIIIPVEWDKISRFGKFTAFASVIYAGDQTLTQELTFWGLPSQKVLLGSGLVAGIVIIFLLVFVVMRKIHLRKERKKMKKYIVKKDDTIESVASRFSMNWTKLAKTNKLKPPYTLIKNQKIFVLEKKDEKRKKSS